MEQPLPDKFKDLRTGARVRIDSSEKVPRITEPFTEELGAEFDMLVALHSHGSNIAIIEVCARHPVVGVILPCCVIDEPQVPPVGENWFMWLVGLAQRRGLSAELFALNFSGQNVGMVIRGPGTTAGSNGPGRGVRDSVTRAPIPRGREAFRCRRRICQRTLRSVGEVHRRRRQRPGKCCARILRKRYNYECEVIDPRGWTLNGVPARQEYFDSEMASFYDLVIGLHPDQALPSVVEAGATVPRSSFRAATSSTALSVWAAMSC